jgi:hypothetical protein
VGGPRGSTELVVSGQEDELRQDGMVTSLLLEGAAAVVVAVVAGLPAQIDLVPWGWG